MTDSPKVSGNFSPVQISIIVSVRAFIVSVEVFFDIKLSISSGPGARCF